jgi:hypothetical protein
VAEVFAGFVAGYILALISTPLVSLTLLRLRAGNGLLSRLLPPGTSAVGVSVLLHGALAFFWTGLGIVLGLLLLAMRDAGGGAGSLNAPFSLFVAGLVLAIFAPIYAFARPLRQFVLIYGLTVLLVLGWLMPYLARWSTFES